MRILFTADPEIPVPPQHYGGVQRLVDSIARGMKEKGHRVGLVAHRGSTTPVDAFYPWPGRDSQSRWDTLRNTWTLTQAVRAFQPDLIHSFSRLWYLMPMMARPLAKIMTYGRDPSTRTVQWSAQLAGQSLMFTGCSQHISRTGSAAGGTWRTVYNFVELETFTFQPQVAPDAPLVFLSRIERIKGAHTAIAAALRTGRRLIIAGNRVESESGQAYWREEIAPYLGKNGIEYVGPVNDAQKNLLLGTAAAMIVPIEWEEPFGIVFTEALACGTPVISTPRGAVPEIVRQGVDGFIAADLEALCDAIGNLPRLNRADCRQRVESCFTAQTINDQYEQLYHAQIAVTAAHSAPPTPHDLTASDL
ncbi:glycosyltransferase [Lyngbya confervoides]|uniref:Glycosyltransferase n=1 Tax=Lyngbya confervoides BDU141951 TaxID=1574623 RepID=A0ABD4SZ96_9CYAN|nr:glycosyltransferase [Lyngbya confervoides]MCM1981751.1 glycosyltransferase [Lyngbya confervoides BDU141951]